MAEGRYAEAAEVYVLASAQDWIDVQAGRAAALTLAGDLEAAHAAHARLIESYPDFTPDWFLLLQYGQEYTETCSAASGSQRATTTQKRSPRPTPTINLP